VRDLAAIDRELTKHSRMRAQLVEQRRCAPWATPVDEDVDEVRADLDACITAETNVIDALMAERDRCKVDA
jgi:hypothetical protein